MTGDFLRQRIITGTKHHSCLCSSCGCAPQGRCSFDVILSSKVRVGGDLLQWDDVLSSF